MKSSSWKRILLLSVSLLPFSRERGTGRRFQQEKPSWIPHLLSELCSDWHLALHPHVMMAVGRAEFGISSHLGWGMNVLGSCLQLLDPPRLGSLWLVEGRHVELPNCTFPILKTWLDFSLLLLHDFVGDVSWEKKRGFISAPLGHCRGDVSFLTTANVPKINSRRRVLAETQRLFSSSITGQG